MIQGINSCAMLRKAKDFPEMAGMVRRIIEIMRQKKVYYVEEAKGVLAAFLVNIARENRERDGSVAEPEGRIAIPVCRAMDYIELHYMEPLKVDDLADWCHISEAHLRMRISHAFYV